MIASQQVHLGRSLRRHCLRIGSILIIGVAVRLAEGAGEHSAFSHLLRGPGLSNHPIGVRPSSGVQIPEDWPLARDGTLTCLTCHESLPAGPDAQSPRLRGFELTDTGASEFCSRCHSADADPTSAGMHWLAVGRAHIRECDAASGGLLDSESRRCMACHDGVNAPESANSTPWRRNSVNPGDRRRNHPIGVEYPAAPRRGSPSGLRPVSALPGNLRLPEGKVGCVSCHDLYAADRYHLAVPIEESRLCLACHDR